MRSRSTYVEITAQTVVLAGSVPFVFAWFFGDAWREGAVHLTALAGLSIVLGMMLAQRIRPRERPI